MSALRLFGRSFVHPAYDLLLVGGGASLLLAPLLLRRERPLLAAALPFFLIAGNYAHFAASTVRLYTRPGLLRAHPFLTRGLPLLTLGALAASITFADVLGRHVVSLYLSWSPFHYAAQAYGLALMYCYRSGLQLAEGEKKALRAACLLPFLHNFTAAPGVGVHWLLAVARVSDPRLEQALQATAAGLALLALLAPLALLAAVWRRQGAPLPLLSLSVIAANGVWWLVLLGRDTAFAWATVFHGLQYLAIVLVFHAREHGQSPAWTRFRLPAAVPFYALCLAGGWLLFQLWPWAFVSLGFGLVESVMMVGAWVNIHHFVVDAYIWRLRGDSNYGVVAAPAAAAAA